MGRLTRAAVVSAVAWVTLCAQPVFASEGATAKTNQVRFSYVAPKNPAHQELYENLKTARVLEKMQEFLSPLRLPRPLSLKLEGCDGVSNAWYEDDAVTFCYEYLDDIWKNAHKETRPAGVSLRAAIAGPLYDVFLHEVGHALFDYLKVPLFGREEDAADDVSAYVMLQFGKDDARELLTGAIYSYASDLNVTSAEELRTRQVSQKLEKFSDEHGTPAQRLYNTMCIAYGADPKLFADVLAKGLLPKSRAEGCEGEYLQIAYAYQTLISPHIDPKLAKKVRAKKWLPPAASPPPYHPATAPPKIP